MPKLTNKNNVGLLKKKIILCYRQYNYTTFLSFAYLQP